MIKQRRKFPSFGREIFSRNGQNIGSFFRNREISHECLCHARTVHPYKWRTHPSFEKKKKKKKKTEKKFQYVIVWNTTKNQDRPHFRTCMMYMQQVIQPFWWNVSFWRQYISLKKIILDKFRECRNYKPQPTQISQGREKGHRLTRTK